MKRRTGDLGIGVLIGIIVVLGVSAISLPHVWGVVQGLGDTVSAGNDALNPDTGNTFRLEGLDVYAAPCGGSSCSGGWTYRARITFSEHVKQAPPLHFHITSPAGMYVSERTIAENAVILDLYPGRRTITPGSTTVTVSINDEITSTSGDIIISGSCTDTVEEQDADDRTAATDCSSTLLEPGSEDSASSGDTDGTDGTTGGASGEQCRAAGGSCMTSIDSCVRSEGTAQNKDCGSVQFCCVTDASSANQPPTISSVSTEEAGTNNDDGTLQAGESATLTAAATDPDGNIYSYGWTADDGVTLQDCASRTCTTESLEQGSYDITVTVTDDAGATATETVTLDVAAAPLWGGRHTLSHGDYSSDPDTGDLTLPSTDNCNGITISYWGSDLWVEDADTGNGGNINNPQTGETYDAPQSSAVIDVQQVTAGDQITLVPRCP